MKRLPAVTLYNCQLVYVSPGGKRRHFRTKAEAPSADEALALAEKLVRRDKRRTIGSIKYRRAYER